MVDLYQATFFKRKPDTQQCQVPDEDLNSKRERLEKLRASIKRIIKSMTEITTLRQEECNLLKLSKRELVLAEAKGKKTPEDKLLIDALKKQITQFKAGIKEIDEVIKSQNAMEILRERRAEIIKLESEIILMTSIESQIIPGF